MESTKKTIEIDEIRKKCDANFEEGDFVDRIEPLI